MVCPPTDRPRTTRSRQDRAETWDLAAAQCLSTNHRRSATAAQMRARLAGASIRAASSAATAARERNASPWAMSGWDCGARTLGGSAVLDARAAARPGPGGGPPRGRSPGSQWFPADPYFAEDDEPDLPILTVGPPRGTPITGSRGS